jgi:hypothetical protein
MEQADEEVVAGVLIHQVVRGEIHARLGAGPMGAPLGTSSSLERFLVDCSG